MLNYKTMYKLKNYLLSMQSHWMINQTTYNAVEETLPLIAKYRAGDGVDNMGKTPVHKVVKKYFLMSTEYLCLEDTSVSCWSKRSS